MASLASIGSVVRIQESRFVVIGHRMARDEQDIGMCYLLVPYPLGFVSARNLSLAPVSKIDAVVAEGFATDEGSEYLAGLIQLMDESAGISYDDYADAVLSLGNYMRQEGGDGDE